jgi:hypothetical protein
VKSITIKNIGLFTLFQKRSLMGLETNKQKINYMYNPRYLSDVIVIKKPESKGAFSNRIFNFDPEPYVIVASRGRKYRLAK